MRSLTTTSIRIPRQTREAAARVAEQTGETLIAVIARAVKQAEDELFYRRLAQASANTREGYLAENEPWMNSELVETGEPEDKFWR
ncbi:MAG TPA: hypothetical protein VHU91_02215 [Mycobacteriales bacterium]|jgi:hypothetical protein|nr:hypothetical protein [Mycobacteriales bacterium]